MSAITEETNRGSQQGLLKKKVERHKQNWNRINK